MKFSFAFAIAGIVIASLPTAPANAQRTKQWAADWSRCISHNDRERFRNTCTQDMEVYWYDTNGSWNQVTIRAGRNYPGGSMPQDIYACLALPQNRFDQDARRCYYWE